MSIRAFEPRYMKLGILTAVFQELTPRDVRDSDPDRALEDWLYFAREIGANNLQLWAALHPRRVVPPEAMLDPVANTVDLRRPFDAERAARISRDAGDQERHFRLGIHADCSPIYGHTGR